MLSQDALLYRTAHDFDGVKQILAGSGELKNVPIDGGDERPPLDVIVMRSWGHWINGGSEPETSGPQNLQIIGALDALLQSTLSGRAEPVDL